MDTNTALTRILSNLRQKQNHLNGIMNATRELSALADGGDSESFGVTLNMREHSMRQIDRLNAENDQLAGRLPEPLRAKINGCLHARSGALITLDNPLQTNIYDICRQNAELLKRTADADAVLNRKVRHGISG